MKKAIHLKSTEEELILNLGRRFKRARLRRDLTQAELAKRCGVTVKTYQALEVGKPTVSLGLMIKCLAILGMQEQLEDILKHDPVGDALTDQEIRKAASKVRQVGDF